MTARAWASWRPSALLLLLVPGCFALRGPSTVDGPVGGSLSVQCWYEEKYKTLNKYWCRPPRVLLCDKIVETKGPAGKMNGRVSIRDSPENLSFTVTLENLTEEDTGIYWCGVDIPLFQDFQDPIVQVEVSVFPGELTRVSPTASSPKSSMGTSGPPPKLPVHTWPSVTRKDSPEPSPHPGSLFSNVRFLLLVLLELPLLLSMLGAVLWVNRPQRSSRSRQRWPEGEN
ncbi:CMRF35-like molecule 6 isoform X1 [Theropithecus gelada]|uniref:CMRF35-like molecule 6 isoform X1 n=1 Tax=Theropithecus gelada TaxID=9565 RepID=UPI000DC17DAE|nr:CMRF35-like molecule 6 isoform X1 [Theropithecus gelada]